MKILYKKTKEVQTRTEEIIAAIATAEYEGNNVGTIVLSSEEADELCLELGLKPGSPRPAWFNGLPIVVEDE